MTIRTLTPNPALDVTYRVDRLEPYTELRVRETLVRPGGKGVNVARVLHQLGEPVDVRGFLGGADGDRMADLLAELGVPALWTCIDEATRRTIAVVDDKGATMVNEPGPTVTRSDWERLAADVWEGSAAGDVLTVNGSMPPGTDMMDVTTIVRGAAERAVAVIVDTSGPALLAAAEAGASVLKPNAHELIEATGAATIAGGLAALHSLGAHRVVLSRGADGLIGTEGDACWWVRLPQPLSGNPTGAGDACVAALARGMAQGRSWVDVLVDAVALSAAAVPEPTAGSVHLETYHEVRSRIVVEAMTKEGLHALG